MGVNAGSPSRATNVPGTPDFYPADGVDEDGVDEDGVDEDGVDKDRTAERAQPLHIAAGSDPRTRAGAGCRLGALAHALRRRPAGARDRRLGALRRRAQLLI